MATSKEQLKQYFETGDVPTEGQFEELIDSYRHIDTGEVISSIEDAEDSTTLTISDASTVVVPKSNFYDDRFKHQYSQTITIDGDADTYYQVVIKGGNQNRIRELNIYRRHTDPAPNTWNTASLRGALTAEFRFNAGSWGGSQYDWMLLDFREKYCNMLADAGHVNTKRAFYVMLRGGGAQYHIDSDDILDIQVVYSTDEIIYPHSNPIYVEYGKAPITEVNTDNISDHVVPKAGEVILKGPDERGTKEYAILRHYNNPSGTKTFHIKTPMRIDQDTDMYFFKAEGYAFGGGGEIIDIVWVGYCYQPSGVILSKKTKVGRSDTITAGQYVGSDNHVYIWFKTPSNNNNTFAIDTMRVGNGPLFKKGDLEVILSDAAEL